MQRVTLSTGETIVAHRAEDIESLVLARQFEIMQHISQGGPLPAMMARRQLGKSCARYTDRTAAQLADVFEDAGDMVRVLIAVLLPSDNKVIL